MTTQPSDWAVARAFFEVSCDVSAYLPQNEFYDLVLIRARELDASGDAPRAAEAGDKDGERYRWLRGNLLWAKSYDGYVRWTVEILMPEPGIHEGHPPVAETLDAAIDAARAGERG